MNGAVRKNLVCSNGENKLVEGKEVMIKKNHCYPTKYNPESAALLVSSLSNVRKSLVKLSSLSNVDGSDPNSLVPPVNRAHLDPPSSDPLS